MFHRTHINLHCIIAVVLLAAAFVMPALHIAHAADMEMETGNEMMSMDCDGGECEDTSAQQSCLEHCLQTGASQVAAAAIARTQTEAPQGIVTHTVFEKPALKEARTIAQKTGPPQSTQRHLTTQKRE